MLQASLSLGCEPDCGRVNPDYKKAVQDLARLTPATIVCFEVRPFPEMCPIGVLKRSPTKSWWGFSRSDQSTPDHCGTVSPFFSFVFC